MSHVKHPSTLNGYPVERFIPHDNCASVMVRRGPNDFVLATWWPDLGETWMWGHYLPGASRIEREAEWIELQDRNATR